MQMQEAGTPADGDTTVSAQLLRCTDPDTSKPLTDKQLIPMASMVFWAGTLLAALCDQII